MRRFFGWIVFLAGAWMLVSPQARIGLRELRWLGRYSFSGEALLAVFVLGVAYYLLDLKPVGRL